MLENHGFLQKGLSVTVIPSANHFSMNIGKRFWTMDDTDINRMFPGYNKGETTQRIAAGLFEKLQGYEYGIQKASFYMPGEFIPHVRIVKTALDYADEGKDFGLPYVSVSEPAPFDTTLCKLQLAELEHQSFLSVWWRNNRIESFFCKSELNAVLRFMINAQYS